MGEPSAALAVDTAVHLSVATILNGIELRNGHIGIIKTRGEGDQVRVEWRYAHAAANEVFISEKSLAPVYDQNYIRKEGEMEDFVLRISPGQGEVGVEAGQFGTIVSSDPEQGRVKVWIPSHLNELVWIPMQQDGKPVYRILHEHDFFPFRVTHKYTTDRSEVVEVGDEGKIFAHDPRGWVRVTVPQYPHPIIIPKNRIEVGTHRMTPTSRTIVRQNLPTPPQITPVAEGGLLYRTAFEFFKAIRDHAGDLAQIEQSILDLLGTDDEGPGRMADMIVAGCEEAGTLEQFDSTSFTLASICDAGQLVGSTKGDSTRLMTAEEGYQPKAMIYAIHHTDFSDQSGTAAFYIGESENGLEEMSSHNDGSAQDTCLHYGIWQASTKHRMVNICSAPEGDDQKPARLAMKMFFLVALDACAPKVVDPLPTPLSEAQLEEDDSISQSATSKPKKVLQYQESTFAIANIAEGVFKATGWPQGASRESFGPALCCNEDTRVRGPTVVQVAFDHLKQTVTISAFPS
ncbi:hypothetical protein PRZ48_007566 [Zasmidium cellare]|uniref:Uncharacterized protein n=1 Tax=Zasmidium cellare TaxID=395010 RepID=A0ABR0EJN6_ZASCE|nr:hypothetical protein PRZ48_007566 [Zasmidium cellare]